MFKITNVKIGDLYKFSYFTGRNFLQNYVRNYLMILFFIMIIPNLVGIEFSANVSGCRNY